MADENANAGSQTTPASNTAPAHAAEQTPPQRTTGSQTTPAPGANDDEEEKPITLREARRLRQQISEFRTAKESAEAKVAEYESANQSATEKAQRDAAKHQAAATEWQTKYQELVVKTAIKDQANTLGFHDAEDAYIHLMRSGDLDFDNDTGQPTNAEKLLKKLAESKPYLLKQQGNTQPAPQPGLTPANPSRSSQTALPQFDPKNPPRLTDRAVWDNSKR